MAKDLDLSGFDDVVSQAEEQELDLSGFDEAVAKPSALQSTAETLQDVLTSTADTTLGRTAAGISSGLADLLPDLPSSVDRDLKAKGFNIVDEDSGSAWDTFKRGYYGGKEKLAGSVDEARERSPMASMVGSIGSEIAQAGVGAKGLGIAGKTGSKAKDLAKLLGIGTTEGALSEASRGDSKLLEGDVAGTAEELAEGALYGAAGAGIGAAAPSLVKGIAKGVKGAGKGVSTLFGEMKAGIGMTDPGKAAAKIARRGAAGQSVAGIEKEITGRAKNLSNNIVKTVRDARTTIGKKIGGLREMVSDEAKINMSEPFNDLQSIVDDLATKAPSEGSKYAKDLKKVQDFLDNTVFASDVADVELKKAAKISDELKRMATSFLDGAEDIKDKEILAVMRDFSKKIDDVVDADVVNQLQKKFPDRVNEYANNLKKYRELSDLENYMGTSTMSGKVKIKDAEKMRAGENVVKKLSDETFNLKSMMSKDEIVNTLKEVGLGKFADDVMKQADEIMAGTQALQYVNPQGAGLGTSLARGSAAGVISSAGKVGAKVKKATSPIREGINKLVKEGSSQADAITKTVKEAMNKSDSKAINNLAELFEEKGKMRFTKTLRDIALTKDPTQRAIRSHAIMQQPAFRQHLNSVLGKDEDN